MIPGTNPKLTTSARESSCFPSSPETLNALAAIPSKKSAIPLIKIKIMAWSQFPVMRQMTAAHPKKRLESVSIWGIAFNIGTKINLYGVLLKKLSGRNLNQGNKHS